MTTPGSQGGRNRNTRRPDQDAGQWIIVDAQARLLSIGERQFMGASPRSNADAVTRRILLPKMRAVAAGELPTYRQVGQDTKWQILATPIRSPMGTTVGVIGCYCAVGDAFPPLPEIGAWEARLAALGSDQRVRVQWSDGLYALHGMVPPTPSERAAGAALEWPEWIDEIVLPADRTSTMRGMGQSLFAATGELSIHEVRIHSPTTGNVRSLRIAVRSYRDEDTGDRWQRGIAMSLHPRPSENKETSTVTEIVDTMFSFSGDAMCVIDTEYQQITLTSSHFGDLDLALPSNRRLTELCHPEDIHSLMNYLHLALRTRDKDQAQAGRGTKSSVPVRFRVRDGTWKPLAITAAPLAVAPRQVMCRIFSQVNH